MPTIPVLTIAEAERAAARHGATLQQMVEWGDAAMFGPDRVQAFFMMDEEN